MEGRLVLHSLNSKDISVGAEHSLNSKDTSLDAEHSLNSKDISLMLNIP